jgi:hypothetical protein
VKQFQQQLMRARSNSPPTTQKTGMEICLLLVIHSMICWVREEPWQLPLEQRPPPSQGVPSRKYCWRT